MKPNNVPYPVMASVYAVVSCRTYILPRPRRMMRSTPLRRKYLQDVRSEEHTSELQSPDHIVCRLLLEKKNRLSRAGLIGCRHSDVTSYCSRRAPPVYPI